MGLALVGILVYPTLVALMGGDPLYTLGAGTVFESNVYGDIFGIPLIMQNYSSTILPAIFIVWIASKVHKALSNALPALVSSFFSNILTLLICGILGHRHVLEPARHVRPALGYHPAVVPRCRNLRL